MQSGTVVRKRRSAKQWERFRLTALAAVLSLALAAPADSACPTRPSEPYDPAEYDALLDELFAMGRLRRADFSVGEQ
ncbi:MAG: hypothetical protein ACX939_11740, partial [Hyphococcus sp.]